MWEFLAADERDTEALGTALGRALGGGGLVALVGPLGAGRRGSCRRLPSRSGPSGGW